MQDYEYKDEGGRFLCKLHHRLRCDECHYVSDLRDENKRYREALEEIATRKMSTFLNQSSMNEHFIQIASKALEGEG